jgi:hypothetical protein
VALSSVKIGNSLAGSCTGYTDTHAYTALSSRKLSPPTGHFSERKSFSRNTQEHWKPSERINVKVTLDLNACMEALNYKPEGRRFEFRWGHCIFSIYLTLPAALLPRVNSASNRNDYQETSWRVKGCRRVGLTTLPPSVSRLSRENVGASKSHNPMGLRGL